MKAIAKFLTHPYLMILFRLIVGITFIYASYYKVMDPFEFAKSIHHYLIVPTPLINVVALLMSWLEFFCGLMLILGTMTRANALIIIVLLSVFSAAIISVMVRGIDVECGCLKNSNHYEQNLILSVQDTETNSRVFTEKVGWSLLLRDIILLLMCGAVLFAPRSPLEIDYYWARKRSLELSTRPA